MPAIDRRTTTLLVLAEYLLAVAVGGWAHDHGTPCCSVAGPDAACPAGPGGCGDASTHPLEALSFCSHLERKGEGCPPGSKEAAKCPVCRFLANKSAPAGDVAISARAALGMNAGRVETVRSAGDVPWTHHSRAPPAVA